MTYELTLKVLVETDEVQQVLERLDTFLSERDNLYLLKVKHMVTFPIVGSNRTS